MSGHKCSINPSRYTPNEWQIKQHLFLSSEVFLREAFLVLSNLSQSQVWGGWEFWNVEPSIFPLICRSFPTQLGLLKKKIHFFHFTAVLFGEECLQLKFITDRVGAGRDVSSSCTTIVICKDLLFVL